MREYIHFFENSDLRDAYEYGSDYTEPYVSYTPVINGYEAQFNGEPTPISFLVRKSGDLYQISSNDVNLISIDGKVPFVSVESNSVYLDTSGLPDDIFVFPEDLNLNEESTEFIFNGNTYYLVYDTLNNNIWHVYRDSEHTKKNGIIIKIDIVSVPSSSNDFVHYNLTDDTYNGHEYVDLGLPSGTKWAKMNVGATSETDTGLYFAWGETQGYTRDQVPNDKEFSWNDYKYGSLNPKDYRDKGMTKYNGTDGKTVLDLEDDAAHINMGGDWVIPSAKQIKELTTPAFVTYEIVNNYLDSGVSGILFTSVSNNNKLFFPFAGTYFDGTLVTSGGEILANVIYETYLDAYYYQNRVLGFSNEGCGDSYSERCRGCSVRGVVDGYTVSQIQIKSSQYSSSDEGYRITLTEPIDSNATNIRLCVTSNMESGSYVEYPLTNISEDVNLFIKAPRRTCCNLDIKYELDGKTYLINGWEVGCIE